MLDEHPGLLIRKGDPTAARVVMYPEAYRALLAICRARRPYEVAGVLMGSFARFDAQNWATVTEVMPVRLVPTETELTANEEDLARLATRLGLVPSSRENGPRGDAIEGEGDQSGDGVEPLLLLGSFYADPDLAVRAPRLNLYTVHSLLAAGSPLFLLVNPAIDEAVFYQWQHRDLVPIGGFYELLPTGAAPEIPWVGGWSGADLAPRFDAANQWAKLGTGAPRSDLVVVATRPGPGYTRGKRLPAFLLAALEHGLGSSRAVRWMWGVAVGAELALVCLLALFGALALNGGPSLRPDLSMAASTPYGELLPLQGGGVPAHPPATVTPATRGRGSEVGGRGLPATPTSEPRPPASAGINIPDPRPPTPDPWSSPSPTQGVQPGVTVVESDNHTLTLPDSDCEGGYVPPGGVYRGRSARLALGSSTARAQAQTFECGFNLNITAGGPIHVAYLTIVGLDSAEEAKAPIRVLLNGQAIYEGPDPLANSATRGGASVSRLPDPWGSYSWPLDPTILVQGRNTLSITNLSRSSTANPPFLALDYAAVTWTR